MNRHTYLTLILLIHFAGRSSRQEDDRGRHQDKDAVKKDAGAGKVKIIIKNKKYCAQ